MSSENEILYPAWFKEFDFPNFNRPRYPQKVDRVLFWYHQDQTSEHDKSPLITGNVIYKKLQESDLLKNSLSFANLVFFQKNQHLIPRNWLQNKLCIYGWGSVALNSRKIKRVPYLSCVNEEEIHISWQTLRSEFYSDEPAGLKK